MLIHNFVRIAAGSSNGRTADFESVNLGSIPSLAAKIIIFPGVEINFP